MTGELINNLTRTPNRDIPYSTNKTLGIAVQRIVGRKYQLVVEHLNVHVRMVVCPERRLRMDIKGVRQPEGQVKCTRLLQLT